MLQDLINEDTELFEIVHYFAGFAEGVILPRIGKKGFITKICSSARQWNGLG